MREINRAMADHLDATEMLRKMLNQKSVGSNETRLERRARERAETKAAKRKQKTKA